MAPTPVPFVTPSGDVLFPLASNANALVTGGPVANVRTRMKVCSLLYDRVLLEAGDMTIQAGPHGSSVFRHRTGTGSPRAWQTPRGRKRGQEVPFSLAMAPETTPGVPAPGPYRQVLHSETSICWLPTLEPFQNELPEQCDWIVLGFPSEMAPEFKKLKDQWKRWDGRNDALTRLVPENFVRSRILDDVSHDLAIGASGGWDVSVDRFHGQVVGARFASDGTHQSKGLALPVLVPRVGDLTWGDVTKIRRLKAIQQLRAVLREVESEAFEVARSGGDVEAAMHRAYEKKLAGLSEKVHGIRSTAAMGVAELLVGAGAGYATTGLALLGPAVGAGVTAALMTGWHVRRVVRGRRHHSWIGVMDAISEAALTSSTRR